MKKILTMILLVLCLTLTGCKEKTNINENNNNTSDELNNINENNENTTDELSNIRLAENITIYIDSTTWKYSTSNYGVTYYLSGPNSYSSNYTTFSIKLNDNGDTIYVAYELRHKIKYYIENINENSFIVYKYDIFIRQTPRIHLVAYTIAEDNSKHYTEKYITLSELKELYDIDSYTYNAGIQQLLEYCEKIGEISVEENQPTYFYNVSAVITYAEE